MPFPKKHTGNFILLPTVGLTAGSAVPEVTDFLLTLDRNKTTARSLSLRARSAGPRRKAIQLKVLDSVHENGAKLVTINPENLAELRMSYPGVKVVPEVLYSPAWAPKVKILARVKSAVAGAKLGFTVTDNEGNAIAGAEVRAFTDYANGVGEKGTTNKRGVAQLSIASTVRIDRVYVYPEHSFWPFRSLRPKSKNGNIALALERVDPSYTDALQHFYKTAKLPLVTVPVTVGIIDTGVGPHVDLPNLGGVNLVQGQSPLDYTDVMGHGTHVAGIIGAAGTPPDGVRGVAAGVRLRSYRVFANARSEASNFDILKAIDQAVSDGCDLINLSLGGEEDQAISLAISDAYQRGVVCFAATGNEYRAPVCYPAAAQFSIAVSAMGRKGTWPKGSIQQESVKAPYARLDKANFIADFSNVGPQVDVVAPGVGIISTYPGNFYAAMDGTSMACPVAAGLAARLLAATPAVYNAARDTSRANEMVKLFSNHIKALGFGPDYEGKGMLQVL